MKSSPKMTSPEAEASPVALNGGLKPRQSAPTLGDVARRARVSRASVSVAFNGSQSSAGVSESTRLRIFEAAKALNYRPSRLARSLKSGRSQVVAVLTGDLHMNILSRQIVAIEKALSANNYGMSVLASQYDPLQEQRIAEHLIGLRPDGVIIVWPGAENQVTALQPVIDSGIPIVTTERVSGLKSVEMLFEREKGMRLVTQHLFALGHRNLGLITMPPNDEAINERLAGFLGAHRDAGIDVDHRNIRVDRATGPDGYRMACQLLDQKGETPTAIVCNNDTVALATLRAAVERGLRIPQDLSVTGFYDNQEAEFNPIPLTTVRYPAESIGDQAARTILQMIEDGEKATAEPIRFEPELVIRRSTAPPDRSA